ncbi:MAG: hypothetical protein GXO09_03710 [Crenarchaeota archaeon]|nr:hypothetical protein [Thermoproteota archaeon]
MQSRHCPIRPLTYYIAARLVDYPYDEDFEKLPELLTEARRVFEDAAEIHEGFRELAGLADKALDLFREEAGRLGRDMFQAEYVALFELGMPQPPCPLREHVYKEEAGSLKVRLEGPYYTAPGLLLMAELQALYASEGLTTLRYPPDHLVVELEYMHHLTTKQCQEEKPPRSILLKQENFLKGHLDWLSKLRCCVDKHSKLEYFKTIIRLVEKYIEVDQDLLSELIS